MSATAPATVPPEVAIRPATPGTWADVETVFRDCADAGRCWCAYWYLPNRDFKAGWGEGNRHVLRDRVEAGLEPGVLAFRGADPVGWAGIAPRADFDRLRRSKPLAPVDDRPVWALNCFVVARAWRRQGLMRPLIRGALAHAVAHGATTIEAYPVDSDKVSSWDLYLGSAAAFREAGFVEVARRLPRRPILRWEAR
jgi:GNAT superfamily N-acetyltransferase